MEERFSMLLKAKNITAAKLADEIKAQPSSVSHILSGRNKPGLELIQKILNTYRDISPDWLINGKGPMFRGGVDLFTKGDFSVNEKNLKKPAVSQETSAKTMEKHSKKSDYHNKGIYENDDTQSFSVKESSVEYKPAVKGLIRHETKQIESIVIFYTDKSFSEYHQID